MESGTRVSFLSSKCFVQMIIYLLTAKGPALAFRSSIR